MNDAPNPPEPRIETLSAVTLATRDMARSVRFYRSLGFTLNYGGGDAPFTSFTVGASFLNVIAESRGPVNWWGRVILHVSDVDRLYDRALSAGHTPEFAPRDAPWGERYFHLLDPDGHEISFAKPI